jgi:hypothetical protein
MDSVYKFEQIHDKMSEEAAPLLIALVPIRNALPEILWSAYAAARARHELGRKVRRQAAPAGGKHQAFARPSPEQPGMASVVCDDRGVRLTRAGGRVEEIAWDAIDAILIRTTSDGPFADDVFLCLLAADMKSGCVIPQTADGYDGVYDAVSKFEGFDFEKVIESMASTSDATFLLWRR